MKNILVLCITILSLQAFSQKDYSRYYNSWRLGLNAGGAWQTADYRSCWGMAGGITLEKGLHENATNFFSFAIRGRYLGANTYGMDYNRNYDVKSNDAYNGTYNSSINFSDSSLLGRHYVYDNYKMKLNEGSLELQLTFNRLRERTHILLNLWGGIGFTSYRTYSDLLDASGKQYDFSKVDSTGNKTKTLNTYNGLIDKKYESYAYGSKNGNLVTFSPSAGIGLGYQFSPVFSMLWEYKVTFPQGVNADLLDGKLGANTDAIAGSNDYYHYMGLNLVFTLRGKHKTTKPNNEPAYTNTTVPTNTIATTNTVAVPTNSVVPTNTSVVVNTPTEYKPVISFITPATNGQITNTALYKITAQILNITSVNQIQFKFNNSSYSNFSFNTSTHILEFNANLTIGTNTIHIIATNTTGSDNKLTSVIFDQPKPLGNPPVITITNPISCPSNVQSKQYSLVAMASNVLVKNNINIKINNITTTNFSYNSNNGQIDLPLNLLNGANTVIITVTNNFGIDTKSCIINYTEPVQALPPPVISFINPSSSGSICFSPSYKVKAQILNINTQSDAIVYLNGVTVPFSYSPASKQISLVANLLLGTNTIVINASNSSGNDNKTTSVIYKEPDVVGPPPIVSLINPPSTLNATDNLLYNYKLSVLNVTSKNDITFTYNGNVITNFNYNLATKEVDYSNNLVVGLNTVIVKGTNAFGVDSKTIEVTYTPHKEIKLPPLVTITNPVNSPASTANSLYEFKASILNIPNTNGLTVKYNGVAITNYTYDGINLNYPAVLLQGNNSFEITATNNDGTDVKTTLVIYKPKVIVTPPLVTFLNPIEGSETTENSNFVYSASINHIPNATGLVVKFNGAIITNYSYDGFNFTYPSVLDLGINTLEIVATNVFGTDSKTATVNYKQKIIVKPPVVSIKQPSGNPTVNNMNYQFRFNATNVVQNQVEVYLNGNSISAFNFTAPQGNFTTNLIQGQNILLVKATNNDGTASKTATVNYIVLKDTANVNNPNTDNVDSTNINSGSGFNGASKNLTICHTPSGGTPQTIVIPTSAWPSHQAHGDTQGVCPVPKTTPIKVITPKTIDGIKEPDEKTSETTPVKDTIKTQPTVTPRRPH